VSDELAFLSALDQARLVREGAVSSLELVETYLLRIERLDPALNAYVTVCAEEALAAARSPRPGPFSGVPLPIKDLTETAGIRTTFSSRGFSDNVPERDVELVRRVRDAGFVVLGKTNTPEFGTTAVTESALNGPCRNPWDTGLTPGGSSGGAAAAVAAGLAPLAHGSDGGGSIRIPRVVLRPVRAQAVPRPGHDGAAWRPLRARGQRLPRAHRRRRRRVPRRRRRARARRPVRGAAGRAPIRRRGRRNARPAPHRARARAAAPHLGGLGVRRGRA